MSDIYKLLLFIYDSDRTECDGCSRVAYCNKVRPCLTPDNTIEMALCQRCQTRLSRALHDPIVSRVLWALVDDTLQVVRRQVQSEEAQARRQRLGALEETVKLLYRQGIKDRVILLKVVRDCTGQGLPDSQALVERAIAQAEHPLELPATPMETAMTCWRHEGMDPARKINVIKRLRDLTGLGLKEAKDLAEAAWDRIKQASGQQQGPNGTGAQPVGPSASVGQTGAAQKK